VSTADQQMRETWETSFEEQVARGAYNTAAVEAVVRSVAYYLRDARPGGDYSGMQFCEMGCGAGPNLVWLAEKGIGVSGVDIASACRISSPRTRSASCCRAGRSSIPASRSTRSRGPRRRSADTPAIARAC